MDMFKEHVLTLLMDNSANVYNSLDTKTKTAFTKQYNVMQSSSVKRVPKKKVKDDDYN